MRRPLPLNRINSSLSSDWNLDATNVENRRMQYGFNDILEAEVNRWVELFLNTVKDPMIWFLILISILFVILKNYNQAIILLLATIPLIGMDAFLHWRTQVSTRSLSSRLATHALVIRNGTESLIPAKEVVPGDLVVITTGKSFAADGIIIAGKNLQVDESTLTGESYPAQKKVLDHLPVRAQDPMIESSYWGFAGTRLLTGRALMRIVYIGQETMYGEIVSSTLQIKETHTPLQRAIAKLIFTLIISATAICVLLAIVRILQGFSWIDALLSAAILAIAALPDEFPVVFTFFLGVGVYRLAKKNALVKRAVSVENIGHITYICSDKTGTITEGSFQLFDCFPAPDFNKNSLLVIALSASRPESGDPLDLAIINECEKMQIVTTTPVSTFPFTEDRKRETNIIQLNTKQWLATTKGAPETILALTSYSDIQKDDWLHRATQLAAAGYKIIACAQALIENNPPEIEPDNNYQFAGLLALIDPPRCGVAEAIKLCKDSGIHVLMITGDHPETANAIAQQIGLGSGKPNIILGEDIQLHLEGPHDYFRNIDVIARAIPSQKLHVVTTLQSIHEIVAVTGDGVNDVPALKKGDIGIAMGERGTQSARDVADIILLDDNFDSIVNAIAEGRQLFKNLKLSFKYLLIIHFPFILSAAIIPLLGYPLLYYPIHIVFIELIIHPTCLLVFQDLPASKKLGPVEHAQQVNFFSFKDWLGILLIGVFTTSLITLSFIVVLYKSQDIEHARAFALALLGLTSAVLTAGLSNLRTWISRIITLFTFIFTVLLIQLSAILGFLYMAPLHLHDWVMILVWSLITFILVKAMRASG